MLHRRALNAALAAVLLLPAYLAAGPVYAGTCSTPTGKESDIQYNFDYHTYQFCNGTSWIAYGPGGCFTPQTGAYQPTIPANSGFFVLTSTTYDGNLGGLAGADAKCLTELTGNTNWRGYSPAHNNGQLVGSQGHALLCGQFRFTNLMPGTTYKFAKVCAPTPGRPPLPT